MSDRVVENPDRAALIKACAEIVDLKRKLAAAEKLARDYRREFEKPWTAMDECAMNCAAAVDLNAPHGSTTNQAEYSAWYVGRLLCAALRESNGRVHAIDADAAKVRP